MQPHLPVDYAQRPKPRNLKNKAWLFLLFVAAIVAVIAIMLPKKAVEGQNAPTPTQHRTSAQEPAYGSPTSGGR